MEIFTGVDIVEISRFDTEQLSSPRFMELCFTRDEQRFCLTSANPAEHFAARFAAKEAVIKAISGIEKTLVYSEIEICNREDGRPFVKLHSDDSLLNKINIDVSISHSKTMAIAFVVIWN